MGFAERFESPGPEAKKMSGRQGAMRATGFMRATPRLRTIAQMDRRAAAPVGFVLWAAKDGNERRESLLGLGGRGLGIDRSVV